MRSSPTFTPPAPDAVAVPGPPSPSPGRPCPEQTALAALLLFALALLFAHGRNFLQGGCRPVEVAETPAFDLNESPRAALLQVPGIGPAAAGRIEEYRDQNPFQSVDELTRVPGIKQATLEKLRPWLTVRSEGVGDAPAPRTTKAKAAKKSSLSKKEAAWTGPPLDVNAAPLAELLRIPWVGPKTAQRLIEERRRAPFGRVDDLRRVVGPKTLDRIRPYVRVGEVADLQLVGRLP